MKRDWDLIRDILTAAEAKPAGTGLYHAELTDHDRETVAAHIEMLDDAGYVDATVQRQLSGSFAVAHINKITSSGYDLLDSIRSQTVWTKIKTVAKDKGIEVTFDTIKALAAYAVSQILAG